MKALKHSTRIAPKAAPKRISDRELLKVARCLISSKCYETTGKIMGLCSRQVKRRAEKIMEKLGMTSRCRSTMENILIAGDGAFTCDDEREHFVEAMTPMRKRG